MATTRISLRQLATSPLSSFAPVWQSGDLLLPSANQWTTYNHTLGRNPYLVRIYLRCSTAEGIFAVNDHLSVIDWQANGGTNYGAIYRTNTTLVGIYNWGTFNPFIVNSANWRLRIDLW